MCSLIRIPFRFDISNMIFLLIFLRLNVFESITEKLWTGLLVSIAYSIARFIFLQRWQSIHSEPLFPRPTTNYCEQLRQHEKYQYEPIDSSAQQIRLIRLKRSLFADEPIECEIFTANLQESPKYVALSYVWGDPQRTTPISVNGRRLDVTVNLAQFLRRLRKRKFEKFGVTYWVDGVCINQGDAVEREGQIPLMSAIYSKAMGVVGYLGVSNKRTEKALRFISELSWINLHEDEPTKNNRYWWVYKHAKPEFHDCVWMDIAELFSRELFTRVWILQEVILSRVMVLLCGDHISTFAEFANAASVTEFFFKMILAATGSMTPNGLDNPKSIMTVLRGRMIQEGCRAMIATGAIKSHRDRDKLPEDFLDVIMSFWNHRATDVRDKLYALRSLATPQHTEILSLPIDLKISAPELFCKYYKNHLIVRKSLPFLAFCDLDHVLPGFPSWVPGLLPQAWLHGSPVDPDDFIIYDPPPVHKPRYKLGPAYDQISLHGSAVDYITRVGEAIDHESVDGDWSFVPTAKILRMWSGLVDSTINAFDQKSPQSDHYSFPCYDQSNQLQGRYVAGGTVSEAFMRLILNNHDGKLNMSYREIPSFAKISSVKFAAVERGVDHERRAMKICSGRRFFISSKGYFGLGHISTKVGDEVCIFRGQSIPFTTRKKESYRLLVGLCCVQGLMSGKIAAQIQKGERNSSWIELR